MYIHINIMYTHKQRKLGTAVIEGLGEFMTASADPMGGILSFDLPLFYKVLFLLRV